MTRTTAGRRVVAPAALAVLLTLAGCGGGSGSGSGGGEESKAKENIAASLQEGDSPIAAEDAECFADEIVDGVGVDKLKEYGVLTQDAEVEEDIESTDMSDEDAERAADAFVGCIELDAFLEETLADVLGTADRSVVDCVKDKIDEETYRELMAATFAGDESKAQQTFASAAECMGEN